METNNAPYGLRIKKLSKKKYEGRINIHLRIAYFHENNLVKFFCLGITTILNVALKHSSNFANPY